MAPAITSDTTPCSRPPRLIAGDPTSLLSAALSSLGVETAVDMNSQTTPTSQDGGKDATAADTLGSVAFHPFACLPSARSAVSADHLQATDRDTKQELHVVDQGGQMLQEMINGVGVSPSQNLSLSNACRLSLKAVPPRTVSIIIKNNGACSAGIVSNSVHGAVMQASATSKNCNGGSGCTDSRADVSRGQFIACPVSSLNRMLITPQMPNCNTSRLSCNVSTSGGSVDCIDPVTECDTAGNMHSGVEKLQVVRSKCDIKEAADVSDREHSTAEVRLDAVLSRQRTLVSRADRTLVRLRRLQSREANSSVRRQLAGLVSTLRRSVCQSAAINDTSTVRTAPDLKSMSTLELVGFVRQMQSTESLSALAQSPRCGTVQLSVCPDMADTADRLSSNLRHLESAVDSDATESSSGGETDDDEQPTPAATDEYVVVSDL